MTNPQKFSVVPFAETCAVWEVGQETMRGATVEIVAGKEVRFGGSWQRRRGERLPGAFMRIPDLRNLPVLVSFDPAVAYTAILPFRKLFSKESVRGHRVEFQAMIRELMDRTNLELRKVAAARLGVEDLDAVLFDARVMRLRLDGEEMLHSLPDLAGKELRGMLHVLFTERSVFQDLHDVLHSGKELFVTERGKAAAAFLDRAVGSEAAVRVLDLATLPGSYSSLSYREPLPFRDLAFPWTAPLERLIEEEWGVSSATAGGVIAAGRAGMVSAKAAAFLDRLSALSAASLEKALGKLHVSGTVYVRHPERLPFALPARVGRADLRAYPFAEAFRDLGFEMGKRAVADEGLLLPFLEYYYHRGDPLSHQALSRQIHWIKR